MMGNSLQFQFISTGVRAEWNLEAATQEDAFWGEYFEKNPKEAFYQYGLNNVKAETLSAVFVKKVVQCFLEQLTRLSELEMVRENAKVVIAEDELEELLLGLPFALGAEYVTSEWLKSRIEELNQEFQKEIAVYEGTVALYFEEKNQKLRVPERIFFHLVESGDVNFPFAFMATYASGGEKDKVKHMPLKYALTEYQNEREKLLELLSCLNKAAEVSELISGFMESGELFHPLRLTAAEAYEFLKQAELIEETGILCRIPNWWKKKAASVSIDLRLGEEKPSMVGFDTLISLQQNLVVDGVLLTVDEVKSLLEQTEGLASLKGKWVEINHNKLKKLLEQLELEKTSITLLDALRLELGTKDKRADVGKLVTNGKWLSGLLQNLRQPSKMKTEDLPEDFRAVLRPYQMSGYTWLNYMHELGFGACLADDMGLGKTVQVLAYLEKYRQKNRENRDRCLLIVPASLLGNWQREAEKFTPEMDYFILHGKSSGKLEEEFLNSKEYLTITTYGMAARLTALQETEWSCLVLDEAQAIKNPLTKQTKAIKKMKAKMKIAMTGTPIENDLTNLWSLFDFLNKGLLGTSKEFKEYCKDLSENPEGYGKLKMMISPFMLRRLKTDKSIINDLPEKLEIQEYAALSARQVVLYRQTVAAMEKALEKTEMGIQRKGIVLSTIMKLKQICNHPAQYLGQQVFEEKESGKFSLLKEICETIYEKRERVLIFTQFKEITEYLALYLEKIFHHKGYVLHGGTPVKERTRIVEQFQSEKYVPFLVVSVRAGGTGLNLTKANHVIHFDRWWNPAVENQATDRAFRIGQTKDVMVHKLICKNTIEEKIDEIISGKKKLAEDVIGSGGETWITELTDRELVQLLRLEG